LQVYEEVLKHKIIVTRVSAVDGNTLANQGHTLSLGAVGLVKTNISILEDAKAKNHKYILILEDDIVFSHELSKIADYFEALPANWDMVYFSGNHNGHVVGVMPPHVINDKVLRIHSTYSTHCIGIRSQMYQPIIDKITPAQSPLDVYYEQLQKIHNVYCFSAPTPIVTQRSGFSDILNAEAEYGWLIK